MKGLIRNNLYSVASSLKSTIGFCIFINIVFIIGIVKFSNIDDFLHVLMLGQIGSFSGITATALQKDNASKWSKYERTLPVKMSDIVMARYSSFLIFSVIGLLLASITVLSYAVVSDQAMDLERVNYAYSFGIVFSLLVPAILYPLVLKFGADKSEIMLIISVVITLGLFLGGGAIFAPYLKNLSNADKIYRVACIFISMVAFILSYFIALAISKRKEY